MNTALLAEVSGYCRLRTEVAIFPDRHVHVASRAVCRHLDRLGALKVADLP